MRSSSRPGLVINHSTRAGSRLDSLDATVDLFSIARRDEKVIVYGHYLATSEQLEAAAEEVHRTGDVAALGSAPGCYSVALLRVGETILITDPVGQFPLFTATTADGVLIGSQASELAARVRAPLDPVSFAARIACPDAPDVFDPRTCYSGVQRVPEGTITRIGSGLVRQTEHGRIRPYPDTSRRAAVERLRFALVESIEARTKRSEVLTTDFSGGLDSTSLAFLVARRRRTLGLTSSREFGLSDTDDLARVHKYAALSSSISHRLVPMSESDMPYGHHMAGADEPLAASAFSGPLRARLTVAAESRAGTHLVGEGGDVVLGAPPAYLADLARKGELRTLWQHCVMWARLRTRSPLRLFRRAVFLGALGNRTALRSLAHHIERGRPVDGMRWEDDWIGYWQAPRANWLTADARMALASSVHVLAEPQDDGDLGCGDVVTRTWIRLQTMTQRAVRLAGEEFGVSVHAPFLDTEVVRACLALPAYRRVEPGTTKPLLRAALAGLVPDVVLSRATKGNYIKDVYHGVRRAAPKLRRLLDDSAAADLGLLDPTPVRKALDDAIHGLPTPWGALNEVLAVELWLRENSGRMGST